ncbi:hypothetical protein DPMN_020207 [Dreissena polymorpha]|uniref:Uncharacterized protein n=1 Tax=Dreissena polymorpha TaxID=45954 RepID=A0A9D4NKP4_DREPO|nr:hypothetical protein DPMN_020207 [Dreissena polymorpha]
MPCPFESDMVLILCRSTGIRDAQEEKDTSSINGTTTCRSSARFPGLYQLLSRSLHPPRSGLIPCTGCFPVAAVQVPTLYAVKVPHSTAVQVSAAAALSSDNHLVDGPTDRPTYRQTDMSKAIYPLFFEGGHKNWGGGWGWGDRGIGRGYNRGGGERGGGGGNNMGWVRGGYNVGYRSSIFFLKVKGLSFSITKEGGCGGVGVGTGDGLGKIGANQPNNQPTNQQTNQQTGQKHYVPHYYSIIRKPPGGRTDRPTDGPT